MTNFKLVEKITTPQINHLPKKRTGPAALSAIFLTSITSGILLPLPALAIVGGERAKVPWVVQLVDRSHGIHRLTACTGAALNDLLVVTAQHCGATEVIYPDGTIVAVAEKHAVGGDADLQVMVLSHSHYVADYPTLASDYITSRHAFPEGTTGEQYGYGTDSERPLTRLTVQIGLHKLTGSNDVLYGLGLNGEVEHGDSGGPLVINNRLVGILHGMGTDAASGKKIIVNHGLSSARSLIRRLEHAREMRATKEDTRTPWISATDITNGRFSATFNSTLVHSGKAVVFWVNGNYAGSFANDISYYCTKQNITGGSIISPNMTVRDGDLIQIGIDTGGGAHNPAAAQLIYQKRLNGVEALTLKDGRYSVRMSTALMNSGKRIIIWRDGKYRAEIFNGHTYYAGVWSVPGGTMIDLGAGTPSTNFQIGVVPGSPGTGFGTPASAQILYQTVPVIQLDQ